MTATGPARRPSTALRRAAVWIPLALTFCVAAWVFWESQRLMRSDFPLGAVRPQVTAWVAGQEIPASVGEWESARDAIERAVEIRPDDPGLHELRGDVYWVGGKRRWFNAEQRQAHFHQAIASYQKSLQLRPTEPQAWASLAVAHYETHEYGPPLHEAWARALALGPNEGYVRSMLMDLALATWRHATPAMRKWVEDKFENGPESTRIEINKRAAFNGLQLSITPSAPSNDAPPTGR